MTGSMTEATTVRIFVEMPRDLGERSKLRANAEGMSRSELIRRLLENYLEKDTDE